MFTCNFVEFDFALISVTNTALWLGLVNPIIFTHFAFHYPPGSLNQMTKVVIRLVSVDGSTIIQSDDNQSEDNQSNEEPELEFVSDSYKHADKTVIVVSLSSLLSVSLFGFITMNDPMVKAVKLIYKLVHQRMYLQDEDSRGPFLFITDSQDVTQRITARVRSAMSGCGDNYIIFNDDNLVRLRKLCSQ